MALTMRISEAGLELIKRFEGFRAQSVQLEDGRWMIGYGHTRAARAKLKVTEAEATAILREVDLRPCERVVRAGIYAPLAQNEFDALVSFTFNIGTAAFRTSDVRAYLNGGERLKAAEAMLAWRKAEVEGREIVVDALVRRRAAEQALFLGHSDEEMSAPTPILVPRFDPAQARQVTSAPIVPVDTASGRARAIIRERPPAEADTADGTEETAPEAAARSVAARLTRILGEAPDSPAPAPPGEARPSVAEITRAVSELAGAQPEPPQREGNLVDLPPAEPLEPQPEPAPAQRLVDDLEEYELPNNGEPLVAPLEERGWAAPLLYAMAATFGLILAVWGFAETGRLGRTAIANEAQLYAGPFAVVIGALTAVIMAYYLLRALRLPN